MSAADQVLVTHDHLPNAPPIGTRTGRTVLGTESDRPLLHALGARPDQLSPVVGGCGCACKSRVETIASLHADPCVRPAPGPLVAVIDRSSHGGDVRLRQGDK